MNNLWTNDSLFLRKHLNIPIPTNNLFSESFDNPEPSTSSGFSSSSAKLPTSASVPCKLSEAENSPYDKSELSACDFLNNITASVQKTAARVKNLEETSE